MSTAVARSISDIPKPLRQEAVTFDVAKTVCALADEGFSSGLGQARPGAMCVEAAVCYAMGLPHGDRPTCVHELVRTDKINLNDQSWHSTKSRGRGLRRVAIAQLGSENLTGALYLDAMSSKLREVFMPFLLSAPSRYTRVAAMEAYTRKDWEALNETRGYDRWADMLYTWGGGSPVVFTMGAAISVVHELLSPEVVNTPKTLELIWCGLAELAVEVLKDLNVTGAQWVDKLSADTKPDPIFPVLVA